MKFPKLTIHPLFNPYEFAMQCLLNHHGDTTAGFCQASGQATESLLARLATLLGAELSLVSRLDAPTSGAGGREDP